MPCLIKHFLFLILIVFVNTISAEYISVAPLTEMYLRNVTCEHSAQYSPTCQTSHCARRVIDNLFSKEDIHRLHEIVNKGLSLRADVGGPTIVDINTGFVRDSNGLENMFMKDNTVYTPEDFSHYGNIIRRLKEHVMSTFGLEELYFTSPTFITRLDGRESWEPQAIHDEYWHVHADMNNTAHYQYSGLLYMSDYGVDFTGGKIHFVSKVDHSVVEDTIEPTVGRTLIFTSDAENPHFVERVTSGQRFVLAFWFTCDKRREFQVFLDGQAHTTFSHSMKDRLVKQQQQQQQQQKEAEPQIKKKKHRNKRSSNEDL